MDQPPILDTLENGEIELQGQFLHGSNGTFLANIQKDQVSIQAVYKPCRGERPLWDFPDGTLADREVAAFLLDCALGWKMVPATVFRQDAPLGVGSLQLFIPHDPDLDYFHLGSYLDTVISKVLLFDFMLNNADRKAGHFILDPEGHVWLIDHGLTFHTEEKLRTVAWDHYGEEIPIPLLNDMIRVLEELTTNGSVFCLLSCHLSPDEISALANRVQSLVSSQRYPTPPVNRPAIPWPPV